MYFGSIKEETSRNIKIHYLLMWDETKPCVSVSNNNYLKCWQFIIVNISFGTCGWSHYTNYLLQCFQNTILHHYVSEKTGKCLTLFINFGGKRAGQHDQQDTEGLLVKSPIVQWPAVISSPVQLIKINLESWLDNVDNIQFYCDLAELSEQYMQYIVVTAYSETFFKGTPLW